jgi:hypothetical protein
MNAQNNGFTITNGKVNYNGVENNQFSAYPVIVGDEGWLQTLKFYYKPGQLFWEAIIVGVSFALFNTGIYWLLERMVTGWFGKPKSYKLTRIIILIIISSFISAALLHLLFELSGLNRYYILNYLNSPKNSLVSLYIPNQSVPGNQGTPSIV